MTDTPTPTPNDTGKVPVKNAPDVSFRICPKSLRAMRLMQSVDESRYVLCGVHFEIHPSGKVILVATNGRYMAILKADAIVSEEVKERIEFTVDYPFVQHLPKPSGTEFDKILVHYDGKEVHFMSAGQQVTHPKIIGDYPNWRQVVPTSKFAPVEISVNAGYVTMFQKLAKILGDRQSGENVVLKGHEHSLKPGNSDSFAPYSVFIPGLHDAEFYGIIMPMRNNREFEVPKWGKLDETPAVPIAAAPPTKIAEYQQVSVPVPGAKWGKTFIGEPKGPFNPVKKPGYSIWVEWGKWYEAPTVDPAKFGEHAYAGEGYDRGVRDCPCGCSMGGCTSSGSVDPFGACPCNPLPPPASVVGATAQPAVPHPIIPPSTKVTKAQARKKRKTNVHKRNTGPRKNLDRSRRNRHGKARKNLHVQ